MLPTIRKSEETIWARVSLTIDGVLVDDATFPLTKLSAFHAAITFPVWYSPGDPSICGGGGRGTRICTESQGVVRFDANSPQEST